MLFTIDSVYILTTQKKGGHAPAPRPSFRADSLAAKYLDQIKNGRFPVEVLVRGKNAAENEKLFDKITDAIKAAGVSCP